MSLMGNKTVARKDTDPSPNQGKGEQQVPAHSAMIAQVSTHKLANINNKMAENLSPVRASDYQSLLPPPDESVASRICLVLDLDETLVHSSFKPVVVPDLVIPVEIKGNIHQVYVRKRPMLEEFMQRAAELFEVVVFTASLAEYADPLMDELDLEGQYVHHRLFREHCSNTNGLFVKDLSLMGRPLSRIVIIDNSPTSFLFQPRNSIQCTSWFDDTTDTELTDFLPVLEDLAVCENVYDVLDAFRDQMGADGATGMENLQSYKRLCPPLDHEMLRLSLAPEGRTSEPGQRTATCR
jgi:RNA polymerase II subunit A small phosphatase-like protein